MLPHAQWTVALYTELDAECDQQPAIIVDCGSHEPQLLSLPSGAVNNRPTVVGIYDTRPMVDVPWPNVLSPQFGTQFQGKYACFSRYPKT